MVPLLPWRGCSGMTTLLFIVDLPRPSYAGGCMMMQWRAEEEAIVHLKRRSQEDEWAAALPER